MLQNINRFLENKSSGQVTTLGLALLLVVAGLDHVTGFELSFSIFYLLPIVFVTWYTRKTRGYCFCLAAAALWLFIDFTSSHSYSNMLIPFWNTGVRLTFFLVTASLLAELKTRLINEQTMAKTDGLTGIFNAREFKHRSGSLIELAIRHRHPIVIAYIDIDDFKQVNDESGHSEGDRVLKEVANTLAECVRATDVLGRLGGDEFAVFLPETDYVGAQVMFGRIHEKLTQTASRGKWPIGFSIGVAVFTTAPTTIDEALKTADNLMYRVKKAGKNNLVYEEI